MDYPNLLANSGLYRFLSTQPQYDVAMSDLSDRRPNWGKREWLDFAELQTQYLNESKAKIAQKDKRITELEGALKECKECCYDGSIVEDIARKALKDTT